MALWPSHLSQCLLLPQPKRPHFPCLHAPSLSLIGRESIYEALTFFLNKEQEVAGNGVCRERERELWRLSRSSSCRESNNKSGKSTSWQEAEPESRRSHSSSKAEWHPNKRPAPNPHGKMRMALSAQEGDRWALFNQDWKHSPIERLGLWGMDPEGVAKPKAAKAANVHLFSATLGSNEARAGTFNWLGQKSFLIRHTAQGWGVGTWAFRTGTSRNDASTPPPKPRLSPTIEVCHLGPKPSLAHSFHSLKRNVRDVSTLPERTTSRWLGNEPALGWFMTWG